MNITTIIDRSTAVLTASSVRFIGSLQDFNYATLCGVKRATAEWQRKSALELVRVCGR